MNTDVFFARLLIFLPVALLLFVTGVGGYVVVKTVIDWRRQAKENSPPGAMWQGLLFVTVLDLFLLAGLDVGQFLVLVTENWDGILAITGVFFAPWLAYKGATLKYRPPAPSDPTPPPEHQGE